MKTTKHESHRNRPRVLTQALILAFSIPLHNPACATEGWVVIDIGPDHFANAINDAGTVVGSVGIRPFRWDPARGRRTLPVSWGFGYAYQINAAGQVVGVQPQFSTTPTTYHAVVWDDDLVQHHLGSGMAYGINDAGHVVGGTDIVHHFYAPQSTRGFLWQEDVFRKLDDFQLARAVNNSGQIVGQSGPDSDHPSTAILWDPARGLAFLGALPGDNHSVARDINNQSQVVGVSFLINSNSPPSTTTAFVWINGDMTPLNHSGFDGSSAYAVNDTGQVVGSASQSGVSGSVPVLWQNGESVNLNDLIDPTSGWVLVKALDINERMEIVGQGLLNGQPHAFLLTRHPPVPPLAARQEGREIILTWTENAIPVVLQSSSTPAGNAFWNVVLDTSHGQPGDKGEYRAAMEGDAGFFRLLPRSSAASAITSR